MGRFRDDEQFEYKEFGDFGGSGKKKNIHVKLNEQKKNNEKLKRISKALATGTAAAIIVTGGVAAGDSDLADRINESVNNTPISQGEISPKDLLEAPHEWDDGVIKLEATCTEDGIMLFTCKDCGETKEEAIEAAGHKPVPDGEDFEATCTEGGHTAGTVCEKCGETIEESKDTDPLGHDWGDYVQTKVATCTEDGVMTSTCENCGETQTKAVTASGHKWSDYVETYPATCTEYGLMTSSCGNCGETRTQNIPLKAHEDNNRDYHCDNCGAELVSISIAGIDHEDEADSFAVNFELSSPVQGMDIDAYPVSDVYIGFEWDTMGSEDSVTLFVYTEAEPDATYTFALTVMSYGDSGEVFPVLTKYYSFSFGPEEMKGTKDIVLY